MSLTEGELPDMLLPFLSKIIESFVYDQTSNFLNV